MNWLADLLRPLRPNRRREKPARTIPPLPDGVKAANEAINALPPDPPAPATNPVAPEAARFDPAAFFAGLRQGPLRHQKPSQVAGTEAILAALDGLPLSWAAYALATAWHETAATMQPVMEAYWMTPQQRRNYFMRMYDKTGTRPHVARELGNTEVGDGARFAGRGYVQLTGRRNYEFAGRKLGLPLVDQPDLALKPDVSARILVEGMKGGWFTGRGFVAFLPREGRASRAQFVQARRIVNRLDRAEQIAEQALAFQDALAAGGWP